MNQQKKEDSMSVGAVMFIMGVLMIIASVWIYSKSEDTAFDKLLDKQNQQQGKIKELEELINSNISTVAKSNLRVQDVETSNKETVAKVDKFREELDVFRDQCADTREKQAHLRDALSTKRPIVNLKPSGPIQIEIMGPTKPQPPPVPKKGTKGKPLGRGVKSVMGVQ